MKLNKTQTMNMNMMSMQGNSLAAYFVSLFERM